MRQRGQEEPEEDEQAYALRMQRDRQTYSGRNLRTGEKMTEEGWEALAASQGPGLPTWNPNRANHQVTVDLTVDIEPPPGEVIDLRARDAVDDDDVFEMPAWARGEQVFRSERE
jgi:hypothetical protein